VPTDAEPPFSSPFGKAPPAISSMLRRLAEALGVPAEFLPSRTGTAVFFASAVPSAPSLKPMGIEFLCFGRWSRIGQLLQA